MNHYLLHPGAAHDLTEIHEYIAHDNPPAADRMLTEFERAFKRLAEFPLSGRAMGRRLRIKVMRDYLILYSPQSLPIQIVVVAHGNRHPIALLKLARERS